MGTMHLNIWIRNTNCDLLPNVWRTDLVVQACTGSYLIDTYPEIIDQLKQKYASPAKVVDLSEYPLTDQGGKTLELQIGSGSNQILNLIAGTTTAEQIYTQAKTFFTNCKIELVESHLVITTTDRGPQATITLGGTCDIVWGPIEQGNGYKILTHFYQNAWRIMLQPPSGRYVNHIEMDVPPGCYKIWTRVCHGANEETSVSMINGRCDEHICVNLILPYLKTCAANIVHPIMDHIVHEQFLQDDEQRLNVFRGVLYAAQKGKQNVIEELDYRVLEAQEKGDYQLEQRIIAVKNLALLLPDCL